jgi:hypothetical protein
MSLSAMKNERKKMSKERKKTKMKRIKRWF